ILQGHHRAWQRQSPLRQFLFRRLLVPGRTARAFPGAAVRSGSPAQARADRRSWQCGRGAEINGGMTADLVAELVPGRECGDCTVCCTVPTIDQPGIQKPAGATCRHCDHGCRIHATRPEVCRVYFCAWRQMEIFSDDWRPDRSGVFSELETDVPDYLMASVGISLTLTGNPLKTIRQAWFIEFIATCIRGGGALCLA